MAYTNSQIAFHEYVMEDLFSGFDDIRSRKMFGGYGVYQGPYIFALLLNEHLYFKVDDFNRVDFEVEYCGPFTYKRNGKEATLQYYELPESVAEDAELLETWVEKAVQVSVMKYKK